MVWGEASLDSRDQEPEAFMIARGLPFVLLIGFTATTGAGQLPSSTGTADETVGSGVIVGQVIDPGSGRGVPGAIVSIAGPPAAAPVLLNPSAPPPTPNPSSLTTADGRFLFRDLRKGTYFITATKPGYLTGAFGARRPGGGSAPIDLEDGEHVTDVVVPVWKWATLSGTVTDEAGEPVVGLEVRAYRRGITSGRRQFASPALGSTDDRGEYRISNLMPGDYVVATVGIQSSVPMTVAETLRDAVQSGDSTRTSIMSAMLEAGARTPPMMAGMPNAIEIGSSLQTITGPVPPPVTDATRVFVYPTTFHPAARTLREATVLTLRSGEDRTGIDFDLKPLRAMRVSGTLVGPDGPGSLIAVRLEPADGDIVIEPEAATMTDASGAFVFPSVPSGQYVLRASRVPRPAMANAPTTIVQSGGMTISSVGGPAPALPPVSTDPTLWAAMPLAVGQIPLSNITVTLHTGSRVSGRIVFDGTADRPDAAQVQRIPIFLEPEGGAVNLRAIPPGRVDADGNFSTAGAPGGRYFVRPTVSPPNWHFKEARYESIDLADTAIALEGKDVSGVTIVFTDRPTELSGTIRSGQGPVDPDAAVLVFPAEPEHWQAPNLRRLRSVRASKEGVYKMVGLPPGDYYVVAVPDESTVDWQDARLLAAFARDASRLSLDDGEKKTQDLRTQQRR
jgi:hypothetical protein